jgi:hypothetical protein
MSNFILNIVRRSAGLGPGVLVEPAPGPVFLPTLRNAEMPGDDADAGESKRIVQDQPAAPARRKRVGETKEDVSIPGDKQSRRLLGNQLRSEPDSKISGKPIGDIRFTAKGREGATDRFTSDSSVVGNVPFNSSATRQPPDSQPRNLQSIIEPRFSANLRYPNEKRSNLDELWTDGPRQAREPPSTGLTPRLSEAPGKKERSGAKSQSDQMTHASEDAPTSTVEPAATGVTSSDSLWESHSQPDPAGMPLPPQPIQVRIGTIEVRAEQVQPARVAVSSSPAPQSGFDDYKFIR